MQRLTHRCPCCEQPLRISWDMWGQYYLCGECGFTAEDDDELNGKAKAPLPSALPELIEIEAYRLHRAAARR